MVIDYRESRRAITAQKVLAAAGVAAVYLPDKWVAVSDDPMMTQWLVQRLLVPAGDAERALAVLCDHALWDGPLGTEGN